MSEILVAQLEACRLSGEMVGFHKWDDDPVIFLVGFVHRVYEGRVWFRTVDSYGRHDGEFEVDLEQIQDIHRNTPYLVALKYLHDLPEEVPREIGRVRRSPHAIVASLARAMASSTVVTLQRAEKEKFTCLVRGLDDAFVEVEPLTDGLSDGRFTLRLSTIRSVTEESERELAAKMLYDAAQGG